MDGKQSYCKLEIKRTKQVNGEGKKREEKQERYINRKTQRKRDVFCLRFALIYIPSHILHKLKRNYIQGYKYTSEF